MSSDEGLGVGLSLGPELWPKRRPAGWLGPSRSLPLPLGIGMEGQGQSSWST